MERKIKQIKSDFKNGVNIFYNGTIISTENGWDFIDNRFVKKDNYINFIDIYHTY